MIREKQGENCCGCRACSEICKSGAIQMKKDARGFVYPQVDPGKCKDCGLCRKVCPMEKTYVGKAAEPDTYAVCHPSKAVRQSSSSGGMFSLLADWILKQGGVVYGVEFDEKFTVRHQRGTCPGEVAGFRTSKYVESDLSRVYETIGEDLKAGHKVLLTGTPCQIAGVTGYLRVSRVDVSGLYTCDNICHGVPGSGLWETYLRILQKKYLAPGDEIVSINMRSKKVSWRKQVLDIQVKKGSLAPVLKDFSFNTFYHSLYGNRPSCFACHYTSYKRPSDITLGDFWGIDKVQHSLDISGGVNAVLVNTEKGRELFEGIRENAQVERVTREECWQPHLEYSAKKPGKYEAFWKEYQTSTDKEQVFRRYMKGSLSARVIKKLSPVLQKTGLYTLAGKAYKIVFVKGSKG